MYTQLSCGCSNVPTTDCLSVHALPCAVNATSWGPPSVGVLIQRAMIITMFLLYNQIAAQLLRVFDLYAYPLYGERVVRLGTSIKTSSPTTHRSCLWLLLGFAYMSLLFL